jgi:uncharacterized protein YbaP (TraB family)
MSNMPMHLDQCVKDIFKTIDQAYLEADQLAIRLLPPASQSIMSMRLVAKYFDESTQSMLVEIVFGNQSNGADQLLNLDAQVLLNFLSARIPGSLQLLGIPDYGLDVELTLAAKFLNKKLDYIESPEDELAFFQRVPPEVYASAITSLVKLFQSDAILYLNRNISLMQAVASGDEEGIISKMKFDGFNDLNKHTITDRNESIAEKIISRLSEKKDKSVFIALGAAHLAGEGSVVQRLKAKGYTATRLCQ